MEPVTADQKPAIRVGVLTISDRASRGEMADRSGPAIGEALRANSESVFAVTLTACIADEVKLISRTLRRWADDGLCDCILTTGGTGLAERDVTPEATERVLDQTLPYVAMYLALEGVKTVPTAVLSRGVAGARGPTLIVNLPGSPNGAASGAGLLAPIIPHAVAMLQGRGQADHGAVAGANDDADTALTSAANAVVAL